MKGNVIVSIQADTKSFTEDMEAAIERIERALAVFPQEGDREFAARILSFPTRIRPRRRELAFDSCAWTGRP